jgi:hypothetical protein
MAGDDDDIVIVSDGEGAAPAAPPAPGRPRGVLFSLISRGKAALAAAEPAAVLAAATEEALELIGRGGKEDSLDPFQAEFEEEGPEDGEEGKREEEEEEEEEEEQDEEDESWQATGTQEDTQGEPPKKRGKN